MPQIGIGSERDAGLRLFPDPPWGARKTSGAADHGGWLSGQGLIGGEEEANQAEQEHDQKQSQAHGAGVADLKL